MQNMVRLASVSLTLLMNNLHDKIGLLSIYSVMNFDKCLCTCIRHCNQNKAHCSYSKKFSCTFLQSICISRVLFKLNYTIILRLCLASFVQDNVFSHVVVVV